MRFNSPKISLGFTLTELMVSLVLSSLLMIGTYRLIIGHSESATKAMQISQIKRQIQQSRLVLTEEIRFAGFNAFEEAVLLAEPHRLQLWSDADTRTVVISGVSQEIFGHIEEGEGIEFRYEDGTLYEIPILPQDDLNPPTVASFFETPATYDWADLFPVDETRESWKPLVRGLTEFSFSYKPAEGHAPFIDPENPDETLNEHQQAFYIELDFKIHDGGLTGEQLKERIESGEELGKMKVGSIVEETFSIRLDNRS